MSNVANQGQKTLVLFPAARIHRSSEQKEAVPLEGGSPARDGGVTVELPHSLIPESGCRVNDSMNGPLQLEPGLSLVSKCKGWGGDNGDLKV